MIVFGTISWEEEIEENLGKCISLDWLSLVGLNTSDLIICSRCGTMTRVPSIVRDERGGPLVEESLLLGLAVITISIVIAVILQATGWAQDVITGLIQLLQNSWSGLTNLMP